MLLSPPVQPHCAAAVLPQKACTIQAAVPGSLEAAVQVSLNTWGEQQNPFYTSLSQRREAAPPSCIFLSCRVYSLGKFLFYWLGELNHSLRAFREAGPGYSLEWWGKARTGDRGSRACCSSRIEGMGVLSTLCPVAPSLGATGLGALETAVPQAAGAWCL